MPSWLTKVVIFFIRDWSSNGLQINGESISRGVEGQQLLKDGDILSIGRLPPYGEPAE